MAFTLPQFNLVANIWHDGTATSAPPDLTPDCQLYLNTRGLLDIAESIDEEWVPPVYLRCPVATDVRRLDTAEVPAGSGRWYHVRWVESAHLGFPNEYIVALCNQLPGFVPPSASAFVEMEGTADAVLMEDGTEVLME